jgi:pimeloyl-[acyl-carrier protein] synthase
VTAPHRGAPSASRRTDPALSLVRLLKPEILANPYPLYQQLRIEDPVHWDPYLNAWVVTRYADVVTVLLEPYFSANTTPTPEQLTAVGLEALNPIAQVMIRQMLFLDPPAHSRIRGIASKAFTPRRVESLRVHIQDIVDHLLDSVQDTGKMDVMEDLAIPLPTIVMAELLGMPPGDREQLKAWSADFAEVLGNFQYNPERASKVLRCVNEMTTYFHEAISSPRNGSSDHLINAFITAEDRGDRLTEEEIIANMIVTMVGGQETTTNLIGNGVLSLLRNPDQLERLHADPALIPTAIEELLRYESPSQHTARMAVEDVEIGGTAIRQRQGVIAVMGAANRDPARFPDPDRLDVGRQDNRHVAFGWASHFCFGAPLARLEGHIAFATLLQRMPDMRLDPGPLTWRQNLGLRGLTALPVSF